MRKLLFIGLLLLSYSGFSQGILTSTEVKDAILTITPSNAQSRVTGNLPIQALKVKRLRLDTLLKVASENFATLVVNKADLTYVNTQLGTKTTTAQVNTIVAPKMDSTRVKTLLGLKANTTDVNDKVSTATFNSVLSTKANSSDVALKENTADVNAKLNFKVNNSLFADTTIAIRNALNTKSSIVYANLKLHNIFTKAQLIAFTDSEKANFDGSEWVRKAGNVASNGGAFAGTIINVNASFYWERKYLNIVESFWFGVTADGTTDDYTALNLAQLATKSGQTLNLQSGVIITGTEIVIANNIIIKGNNSTIKIKNATRIRNILKVMNLSTIEIYGVTFDMNVQNTTAYLSTDYASGSYNVGIYCSTVDKEINIHNCNFKNVYNESISFYNTSAPIMRIVDNNFTSPTQSQNLRISHISLQTMISAGNLIIERNNFDNAQPTFAQFGVNAIFMEGVDCQTVISKNKFNWCGRDNVGQHRLLAVDLYGNCNNLLLSDNIFQNCIWGFVRLEASQNVVVEKNKFYQNSGVLLEDPAIWITSTVAYTKAGANVRILNNELYASATSRVLIAIAVFTTDWTKPLQNIEIRGNSVFGRFDEFVRAMPGVDGLDIMDNKSYLFDGNLPKKLLVINRITSTEPTGVQTTSSLKRLNVTENKWVSGEGAVFGDLSTYTGIVENVTFSNNKLKGLSGFGAGIRLNNIPCIIENNYMTNNTEAVWITGNKRAYIFNNKIETMDNAAVLYLAQSTNFIQAMNYKDGVLIP